MVINKRKKNTRKRGTTWHGWGKGGAHHKGAGNKGGRGLAGTGKRGDAKKPSIWKERYFGKFGFSKRRTKPKIRVLNINKIQENLESLIDKKLVQKENDTYIIDSSKLKFNKLLATGKVSAKFKITVDYASKSAIEKIKQAGGEVILNKK